MISFQKMVSRQKSVNERVVPAAMAGKITSFQKWCQDKRASTSRLFLLLWLAKVLAEVEEMQNVESNLTPGRGWVLRNRSNVAGSATIQRR
jgi:hypothetical protein